jgi:enterochelin esterase-like enzyme
MKPAFSRRAWLYTATGLAAAAASGAPEAPAARTLGTTTAGPAAAALPAVAAGRLERWPDFPAQRVQPRHVDIWLPPDLQPGQRLPVLYMHDGQMLFDARTTWNRQAWHADRAALGLITPSAAPGGPRAPRVPPFMIVGIWNAGPLRHSEYYPQGFLQRLPAARQREFTDRFLAGRPRSGDYLRFLVEELKPAVDRAFPTLPGRENTFVMGSSMGGLISLYALCEHPQVFGGAAGLSTHWIGTREANAALPLAAFNYLAEKLPAPDSQPAGLRLYLDRGTEELDALYGPGLDFAERIVRERGWTEREAMVRTFPGTGHSERDWAARLPIPLAFLFTPTQGER